MGVTASTIWNWENQNAEPALRFLPAIVEFLGYDPLPKPQTVGERLLRLRQLRGWSQKRMAEELEVDPSTLGHWERGMREPAGLYQRRIEKLFAGATRLEPHQNL